MALTDRQTQELHKAIERRLAELRAELQDDASKVRGDRVADLAGDARDSGDE